MNLGEPINNNNKKRNQNFIQYHRESSVTTVSLETRVCLRLVFTCNAESEHSRRFFIAMLVAGKEYEKGSE
jgi:hypothetical protein